MEYAVFGFKRIVIRNRAENGKSVMRDGFIVMIEASHCALRVLGRGCLPQDHRAGLSDLCNREHTKSMWIVRKQTHHQITNPQRVFPPFPFGDRCAPLHIRLIALAYKAS